jgi:thiol-disulfide isomerase/thioredoxin
MDLAALVLAVLLRPGGLEVAHPWLGVQLAEQDGKVAVSLVFEGSPAQTAGIKNGDIIERAQGESIARSADLIHAVERAGVGAAFRLRLVTPDGVHRDAQIKLAVRPDVQRIQRGQLVGHEAPDFEIKKALRLAAARLGDLRGQVVLLDFWATWCGPCMAALPHLQALQDRLGGKGLRVVGVTSDDWRRVAEVTRARGLTYGQVADFEDRIGMRYMISAIPTLVVIGRDGKVVEVAIGDVGAVEQALAGLLP